MYSPYVRVATQAFILAVATVCLRRGLGVSEAGQSRFVNAAKFAVEICGLQQLDGGSIDDVAVGIVLDLLTLIRRGEGLAQIAKAACGSEAALFLLPMLRA
jgi:hypothetical protein